MAAFSLGESFDLSLDRSFQLIHFRLRIRRRGPDRKILPRDADLFWHRLTGHLRARVRPSAGHYLLPRGTRRASWRCRADCARFRFVLHHRCAADDFEVGNASQVGKNLILYTISEISVLLIIAQVLEGEHGDALFSNGRAGLWFQVQLSCPGARTNKLRVPTSR